MNIGKAIGNILPFDPTPGFNLSNPLKTSGSPVAATGTNNVIGGGAVKAVTPSFGMQNGQLVVASSNPGYQSPTHVLGAATNAPSNTPTQKYTGTTKPYDDGLSAADAADKANSLFQIDAGLTSANGALGRLDHQSDVGYGNISRDFQDAYNRLIGRRQLDEADYNNSKVDQLNQYQSARNNVASGARGWLDGAQRTLGANGAGGGSAARYAVPLEAQTMASKGNANAQATNNHNIASLQQNWDRASDDYKNSEQDLNRQKQQGENDFRSRIESQRAELLNTIGTLTGQRAIANGGNYQQALAASSPYTSRISSILNTIDSLAATPAIHEQAVTVGRPDLSGYNFARPQAPVAAIQDPTLAGAPVINPYGNDQRDPILSLFGLDDQTLQPA
jgi:hypothetical protein